MSYNGKIVIDSDSHIREYVDFDNRFRPYIEAKYVPQFDDLSGALSKWQRGVDDIGLPDFLWPAAKPHPLGVYDDYLAPRSAQADDRQAYRAGREIAVAANSDPSIRLKDMDIAGVDISVLFASQSDGFCVLRDIGFESALHRAYNRSTSEYCAGTNGRLRWVGSSSMRDVESMVTELRYWADNDPNFAGAFISRSCPDGTMLDNPDLYPLFEASEELDLPVWVHGGTRRPPLTPWFNAPGAVYHGIGGMYAMNALVGGGVFDMYPKLRVGLFESGIGWVPWFIEKMEESHTPGKGSSPKMKRPPSEIMAEGNLFLSIEADEEFIEHVVDELGDEMWLFATDYPHQGSPWPNGVPLVVDRKALSESSKEKILGANALRFLPRLVGWSS